jgi:hypothetical protein
MAVMNSPFLPLFTMPRRSIGITIELNLGEPPFGQASLAIREKRREPSLPVDP